MRRSYRAFHFIDSPERIHLAGWDINEKRWVVPCGKRPARPVTINLDKPLCKTCGNLTKQITPAEEQKEYRQ